MIVPILQSMCVFQKLYAVFGRQTLAHIKCESEVKDT